jgi:hypothetical protein
MDTVGKHLYVLDENFCPHRLQNVPGFLVRSGNGFKFTTEPRVALTEMEVAEGDAWSHFVVALGTDGIFRRIVPAAGADGVLKADGNGHWTFADISSQFVIPDPLTVGTINVSNLNAGVTDFSDVVTFSVIGTDTITQQIGLNSSNELVIGTIPTISVASFFENQNLTDSGTPNWHPASASDYCTIGNELADPDGIASVVDSKTIRVDQAGDYLIRWRGNFDGWKPSANNELDAINNAKRPGIWLVVNNSVVDWGTKSTFQTRWRGSPVFGEYFAQGLAVNSTIKLQLNGSIQMGTSATEYPNRTGLTGVGLTLSKVK